MSATVINPPLSLDNLTPQQKAELLRQLQEEQATAERRKKEGRKNYKDMASKSVTELFAHLVGVSQGLNRVKQRVYDELETLVKMKAELYDQEQDQFSHTFSNDDASISITIGHRIVDGWDDTVNTGIAKVNAFLDEIGKGKDKDTKRLISTIHRLLSKDAQGNLKASRVLELKKIADDFNNPALTDAIQIISDAYKPKRTKRFVSCRYRNGRGEEVLLPLNITDAEFQDKETGEPCPQQLSLLPTS